MTALIKIRTIQLGTRIKQPREHCDSNSAHLYDARPICSECACMSIAIMDCSSTGHGSSDTRYVSSGVWNTGVGRGIFRLYVAANGTISGYSWSTYSSSVYYRQTDRPLAVGRLIP